MSDIPNLHQLLAEKYPAPKFVFQHEVPNGTSNNKTRSCDAICIGCWQSVGIQIIGFEIKDSRSDWLKELQDPSKSQAWMQYCHSWYLVAQKGVAKLEELPPSWGLMEPSGGGLKIRKACDVREPKLMPVSVMAGLCRALKLGNRDESQVDRQVRDAYSKGYQAGRKAEEQTSERFQKQLQENSLRNASTERELSNLKSAIGMNWNVSVATRELRINAFRQFVSFDTDKIHWLKEHAKELVVMLENVQAAAEDFKAEVTQ